MHTSNDDSQIESRIRDYIAKNLLYSSDGFPHGDDASFIQEGIVDSLGILQLVEFVQKDFEVTVDQQEVTPENFDSVNKLGRYVRWKKGLMEKV